MKDERLLDKVKNMNKTAIAVLIFAVVLLSFLVIQRNQKLNNQFKLV